MGAYLPSSPAPQGLEKWRLSVAGNPRLHLPVSLNRNVTRTRPRLSALQYCFQATPMSSLKQETFLKSCTLCLAPGLHGLYMALLSVDTMPSPAVCLPVAQFYRLPLYFPIGSSTQQSQPFRYHVTQSSASPGSVSQLWGHPSLRQQWESWGKRIPSSKPA